MNRNGQKATAAGSRMNYKRILITICLCMMSTLLIAGQPKVLKVKISNPTTSGSRTIQVTVAHGDTGWTHYADAFEISTPDGKVLNTRVLAHPHVNEQPFTRSAHSVNIPAGVSVILVRAKDSVHGWGEVVRVAVP